MLQSKQMAADEWYTAGTDCIRITAFNGLPSVSYATNTGDPSCRHFHMTSQQPTVTDDDHRVVKFKPRALAKPPGAQSVSTHDEVAAPNLVPHAKIEVSDYRHRMLMNIAALIFTLLLTGIGVWLATTITELRQTQDCLMVGRRDCSKMPPLRAFPPRSAESI